MSTAERNSAVQTFKLTSDLVDVKKVEKKPGTSGLNTLADLPFYPFFPAQTGSIVEHHHDVLLHRLLSCLSPGVGVILYCVRGA